MSNPNDKIRDEILRYLFMIRKKARGPKGLETGIRDLQAGLKGEGIKQAALIDNLDYLVQKGWVHKEIETRPFETPKGFTTQNEKITYKISDVGIDKLEGASTYQRRSSYNKINITNINGVTVVGEGNVVNTQYASASQMLSEIEKELAATEGISETDRLNALADIATIQSQLTKPAPDLTIIEKAWRGAEIVVTAAGLAELGTRFAAMIGLV